VPQRPVRRPALRGSEPAASVIAGGTARSTGTGLGLVAAGLARHGQDFCEGRRARCPVCPRSPGTLPPAGEAPGLSPDDFVWHHLSATPPARPRRGETNLPRPPGPGSERGSGRAPVAPLATRLRPDPHATQGGRPAGGDRYRGRGRASPPLGDRSQTGPGVSRRPRRTSGRRSGRAPSYPRRNGGSTTGP